MVDRDHQVLATVDIDQTNFPVLLDYGSHERDCQGALSPEHQRRLTCEEHVGDGGACRIDHLNNLPPGIRLLAVPVGGPPCDGQIAVVSDPNTVGAEISNSPLSRSSAGPCSIPGQWAATLDGTPSRPQVRVTAAMSVGIATH